MALSTIPFSGLGADASKQGVNFRNLIINGDMSIAQRGTSKANAGEAGGAYQVTDRFKLYNSSLGQFTISQSTDVPTGQGFGYSTKWDCTTADASPSANDYAIHSQSVEGQMLQHLKKGTANAESLTLSFWVKSNKTGTYVAELFDTDNTRQISKSYTIDSVSTWEKKTITFEGDTTGAFANNNDVSLLVHFWLGVGSTYNTGTLSTTWTSPTNANRVAGQVNLADNTANEWYITGVQLEVGTSASDFEFLPYDVNLQRCQRYFEQSYAIGTASGTATGTGASRVSGTTDASSNITFNKAFKAVKRTTPTITTYNNGGTSGVWSYSRSGASGTLSTNDWTTNDKQVGLYWTVGSSHNFSAAGVEGHWVADAEL